MTTQEANGIKRFIFSVGAAVVAALIIQSCGFFYWAGGITAEVGRNTKDVADLNDVVLRLIETRTPNPEPR